MFTHKFALIALGGNLPSTIGNAGETLRLAARILHENPETTITAFSRLWSTPAVPAGSGPNFVNGAIKLRTALNAVNLLTLLHEIEAHLGRNRSTGRWSSRVLDLDLIGYEDLILPDPDMQSHWVNLSPEQQRTETPDRLILPHPRLQDRGFVLAPLAEIAPDWVHPVTGRSVSEMLAALPPEAIAGMRPFEAANTATGPAETAINSNERLIVEKTSA